MDILASLDIALIFFFFFFIFFRAGSFLFNKTEDFSEKGGCVRDLDFFLCASEIWTFEKCINPVLGPFHIDGTNWL